MTKIKNSILIVAVLVLFAVSLVCPSVTLAQLEGTVEGRGWVGPLTYNVSGATLGPRAVDQHNLHRYDNGEFSAAGTTIEVWGVAHNVATELAGSANYSNGDMGFRGYIRYVDSRGYAHMAADTGTIRYSPGTKQEYRLTAVIPAGARSVAINVNNGAYWSTASYTLFAASLRPVQVKEEPPTTGQAITVYVDQKLISLADPPLIKEGRTLAPMRAFFEALGAEVTWDAATRTAIGTRAGITVKIPIDSTRPFINDTAKTIDVPAQIINGRTYIPLRFVGEALGDDVVWEGSTRTIYITRQ
jgi:hypothetical protein